MNISHYSFGSITVDGQTYTKDVIIFPGRVLSPWWRKEGHLLQIPDLDDVVGSSARTLIIGTGFNGTMRVPEKTMTYLETKGFTVHIAPSREAVRMFNEMSGGKPVIAALHLTC